MIDKRYIERHGRAVLERLPSWLPYVVCIYVLVLIAHSFGGTNDVAPGTTAVATHAFVWYAAMGFNLALVAVGFYSVGKTCLSLWDTWTESAVFIERLWKIAKQGPSSAGLVGKDLGEPDKHGVYTRTTRTREKLYLRMARGSMSGDTTFRVWQWSVDKRLWISTAKADQLWNTQHSFSGMADKILLRRLEVETAFREKQPFLSANVQPPAIELHITKQEDRERLTKSVPRSFLCPISMELMTQPVVTPSGITYDRKSLMDWIEVHHQDPATHAPLRFDHLYPNLALRDMIQEWLVEHHFLGMES